jgi:hypothetical protein
MSNVEKKPEPVGVQGARINSRAKIIAAIICACAAIMVGVMEYFRHSLPAVTATASGQGSSVQAAGHDINYNYYNGASNVPKVQSAIKTAVPEWQPPELPAGCKVISFVYGGNVWTISALSGIELPLVAFGHKHTNDVYVITGRVLNNRFYVSARLLDPEDLGLGSLKLSGNKIEGHLPALWDINSDSTAIEIVDNNEVPIYQIIYRRPDVVEVYGIFFMGNDIVLNGRNIARTVALPPDGEPLRIDPASLGMARIFKYPSAAYLGQRIQ